MRSIDTTGDVCASSPFDYGCVHDATPFGSGGHVAHYLADEYERMVHPERWAARRCAASDARCEWRVAWEAYTWQVDYHAADPVSRCPTRTPQSPRAARSMTANRCEVGP